VVVIIRIELYIKLISNRKIHTYIKQFSFQMRFYFMHKGLYFNYF